MRAERGDDAAADEGAGGVGARVADEGDRARGEDSDGGVDGPFAAAAAAGGEVDEVAGEVVDGEGVEELVGDDGKGVAERGERRAGAGEARGAGVEVAEDVSVEVGAVTARGVHGVGAEIPFVVVVVVVLVGARARGREGRGARVLERFRNDEARERERESGKRTTIKFVNRSAVFIREVMAGVL